MQKFLLLIALTLFSSQASAEWLLLDTKNGRTEYIDLSTKRKQDGYTAIWTMTSFNIAQELAGKRFLSAKKLYFFNCQERTLGSKAVVFYAYKMGEGDVIFSVSQELNKVEFSDVIPDSIGEFHYTFACAKQ